MKNDGLDHANRPRKHGVTAADMEALRQRHVEQAEQRQRASDLNLLRAAKLGEALRVLKGEG